MRVAPRRAAPSFVELTREEQRDLAREPFPYILVFHQAPTDGAAHPEAHLHAELYPAYRMPDRLKYLAGSELGAGVFTADSLPEDTVKQLQAIDVDVER